MRWGLFNISVSSFSKKTWMSNHLYFKDASAKSAQSTQLLLDEAFVITGIIKDKVSIISAMLKAEANKTYQDLNYLGYHKNCSIIHCFEKNNKHSVMRNRINVLNTCLASFSFTLLLSNIDCSSSSSSYKQG